MRTDVPSKFLTYNEQSTKELSVVVKIDGVSTVYSNRKLYTRLKYGMPGIKYGDPGLVYGGLLPYGDVVDCLSLDGSSLSIDQSIDPEEGRGTISQISLQFVDVDGVMTNLCAPGVVVDEIMGRGVEVYIGFKDIAWPDDYFRIFRGYISSVTDQSGKVTFALSDPNMKGKQELLFLAETTTTSAVLSTDTTINVESTADFQKSVNNSTPNYDTVDTSVLQYFKIDDEWIRREPIDGADPLYPLYADKFAGVLRGALGTTAAAHDSGADVTEGIEIYGHPIDTALKLLLSGWGGPYVSGVPVEAFEQTGDPVLLFQEDAIILPDHIDPVRDYGLVMYDIITISGGVNDGRKCFVAGFRDIGDKKNKIIDTIPGNNGLTLSTETNSTATLSFRSQYDTLPFGLKLTPNDVDVARFLYIRNTFMFQPEYFMRFFVTEDIENGKDFIESQIYKPIGAYSLTRGGKLSLGLTKPPLATSNLQILTSDNILNPESIAVNRATNNRRFFSRVYYNYDYNESNEATKFLRVVDFESEDRKGGLNSILTIEAQGARSEYDVETVFSRRGQFILNRYKDCAISLPMTVLFQVGVLIEAGDVVAIKDDAELKLPNLDTGARGIGFKLFEVVKRTLDIKSGRASLVLSAGIGGEATDRYGVISPSSQIAAGSTSTQIILKPSYSKVFGETGERQKWTDHVGQKLFIHSEDFTESGECTLESFDVFNQMKIIVSGLGFTPGEDYVVEVSQYPTSTDKNENRDYKNIYAFWSPTVSVASGASPTSFDVATGEGAKFNVGAYIRVHDYGFTVDSGDVKVTAVSGDTITCEDLGFTPTSDYFVDLIGFADGGASYRFI